MMLKILVLLVLSIFYLNGNVEADKPRIETDVIQHDLHPKRKTAQCYHEKFGHLNRGYTKLPGKCIQLSCHIQGYIEETRCKNVISKEPNCVNRPKDPKKSFPDCCPVKCAKRSAKH
ncbi:hypothetical protein TcasGA2_TC034387 [Tribolium castaneum]|uniref:Single domain-containing protein n=1 Tax=Tribolium castaneum TaxID=7070 RepID=A0A139WBG4_TRICA|nr:PREDICTED: uncharacterized protein LOC103314265 [Tribolium castaneum]KYB25269.1 hypothetical protein TcasGA2_TC034387 [Tribolium castaneum]|eukprot:XP_008198017.1 PREDICTED: uncharacterized protein LOC103314265 [Tribolium castaneum]